MARLLPLVLLLTTRFTSATYLLNGAQEAVFDGDVTTACLQAFNTTLSCPASVQLLSYDISYLSWTESNLTELCTTSCYTSLLTLESAVSTACGDYALSFNGGNLTALQIVDLFVYKYNMSCLTDPSTEAFCLVLEQSWDITALNDSGEATWPLYTNKTYPNWVDDPFEGAPLLDADGNIVENPFNDPPVFTWTNITDMDWTGKDYFVPATADDSLIWGTTEMLEYDEFPLQIQCSSCFLDRFILGIQSQWGEVYDEITEQIWSNIQQNCDFSGTIIPAHNLSGGASGLGPLVWTTTVCDQTISWTETANYTTCDDLAIANNVPSASIMYMNNVLCNVISNGTYCASESCQIVVLDDNYSAAMFLSSSPAYENITITQFQTWNAYINLNNMRLGEAVCVGAPGGSYIPATTTVALANPTAYTTTATPAVATPSGTITNCGLYYEVQSGDECNTVALNFTITLTQLLEMNPAINSTCGNLEIGVDYCVATVEGTTITVAPSSSTSSVSATTTSTFVAAPTQTVTGTTSECYKWYVVASGDDCSTITSEFDITLAQFRAWNTYIDAVCDNLWADYAYCVSSPLTTSSSTSTTSPTTTTSSATATKTYVAAPTQTVTGTTADCYEWYVVESGNDCTTLENGYDITLAEIRAWNTYIDAACDNLWVDYAYCVDSDLAS